MAPAGGRDRKELWCCRRRGRSEFENVARIRERLMEEEAVLERYKSTFTAIGQREAFLSELKAKCERIYGKKDGHGNGTI